MTPADLVLIRRPTRFAPALALALALAVVALVVLAPSRASADPTPADRATAALLKRHADEEMESLRYADALRDYSEAYRLTADPALLYNRGRVLEGLERFPEALEELERFAEEATPSLRARVPQLKELIADIARRVATLTVRCSVADARILVRDKLVGTAPLPGPIRVNAGSATLEVVAEGYLPHRETLDLPGGGDLAVDVKLVPREAKGWLAVTSTPLGADVRVDGRLLGRAPAEAELAPGNHVILLTREGYQDKRASAVIVDGERKDLAIELEKNPPITSRWWFWTGIGVVVVATAVVSITYALTTEKSAGRGDIAPGQVAGPLRF